MCGCNRCVSLLSGSCQCRGCECNTIPLVYIEHPEFTVQVPPVYSGLNQAFAPETPAWAMAALGAPPRPPVQPIAPLPVLVLPPAEQDCP